MPRQHVINQLHAAIRSFGVVPVRGVYLGEGFRMAAWGVVAVFEPIYLLTVLASQGVAHALELTLLLYAAWSVCFAVSVLYVTRLYRRIGVRTLYAAAFGGLAASYIALGWAQLGGGGIAIGISLAAYLLHGVLFFPLYHLTVIRVTAGRRGHHLGMFEMVAAVTGIISPVIGAFLIARFGYPALFSAVAVLAVASAMAYLRPQVRRITFQYDAPLVSPAYILRNPKAFRPLFMFGAREAVTLRIWPLAMFASSLTLQQIGWVTTAAIAVGTGVALLTGKMTDRLGGRRIFRVGLPLLTIGWIARALARTPLGVGIANMVWGAARPPATLPFMTEFYRAVGDLGDEQHLFGLLAHEFWHHSGRALTLVAAAVLIWAGLAAQLTVLLAVPLTMLTTSVFSLRYPIPAPISDPEESGVAAEEGMIPELAA